MSYNSRDFNCLFGVSRPTDSYGNVTITDEGLQILTYTLHNGHWAVKVL